MRTIPSRIATRALALASLASLVGCATLPGPVSAPPPVESVTVEHPSGLRVTTLPRPTPGLVYLSLWIDAGSRDAEAPQTATAAALLAAAEAGPDVVARVLPDGTELGRRCEIEAIDACLAELARGLSLRAVDEGEAAAAAAEILRRRRRALADESRAADRLALEALLGDEAAGFFPLGAAEDDEALAAETIEGFLSKHYGPDRSHLVAVGEVSEEGIERQAADQLGELPTARARRRQVEALRARESLAIEVGGEAHAAVAIATRDGTTAARIARRLLEPTAPPLPGGEPRVRAFGVRGGGLLIVGASGGAAAPLVRDLSWAALRATTESAAEAGSEGVGVASDVIEAARSIGRAWAAGGAGDVELGMAVGAVVPGGRADRLDDDDPDVATRRRARLEVEAALEEGRALANPETDEEALEGGVALTLENGARVSALGRGADGRFAAALRVSGGASEEPARLHGETALLAELIGAECRALLSTVEGARVGVFVEGEAWGLILDAPPARGRRALEGLLRCGLHPELHANAIEDARLELLNATGESGSARWLSNLGAAVIAPERPGLVAPRGSPDGLVRVRRTDLVHARDRMLVGRRVEVSAVGPVDARMVARRAASLLSRLPSGEAVTPEAGLRSTEGLVAARWERENIWVLVAWHSDATDVGGVSSRAFATEAGRQLASLGLENVWSDGGGGLWGSWAAVTLAVDPDELDSIPARVASVRVTPEAIEEATRREGEAMRWQGADPRHAALELVRPAPESDSAEEVLRGLAAASPAYVIIRAQGGPGFDLPAGDARRASR